MDEIYKARSPAEPGQNYAVLAGLRVTLKYGLSRTTLEPTSVPTQPADCTPFHATRCVADAWVTQVRSLTSLAQA